MKQGKTEKAVFAKLSKVELAQHEVELNVDQDIDKLVADAKNWKGEAKEVYAEAMDLASEIGRTLYRAQVNINGDARVLEKKLKQIKDFRKDFEVIRKGEEQIRTKVKQAQKLLGDSKEIDKLNAKLKQLNIDIGTAGFLGSTDNIVQRLRERDKLNEI
jgi:HPt (histidine-containing phosphotransfer) domain-containing protein